MASHGVARTTRAPRTREQREQELEKIRKYRALEDQAQSRVAEKRLDDGTFALTSQLLRLNPEYYTIWNVRRRCLTSGIFSGASHDPSRPSLADSGPSLSPKGANNANSIGGPCVGEPLATLQTQIESVVRSELEFTMPLLVQYPKCYWIWKYRLWVLDQATEKLSIDAARAVWKEELRLVSKMLHKDGRNFHAWGYRRHVVSQLESAVLEGRSAVESEFAYTTKAIYDDLSNFSAWHNRSQLIPRLLQERRSDAASRKELLDTEFAFVRKALDVGPEDQSLWYYHHYLCFNLLESSGSSAIVPQMPTAERKHYILAELANIRELAEDYEDVKRIYEALIEYTLAICQLDSRPLQDDEKSEVLHWLARLRELDKRRTGRWDEYEAQLGLA